ncbi:MAG TPA: hypothetical protein VK610_10720, partial [Rhodothermales bacterium]|nr:hypothetical protein [Rhodothermales bacterium]
MDNLARRIADALPEGQEVGEFETGTAQALVRTYLRSVEDLTAAENDSYAAADRVLARGNSLLRHASDAERGRVRTMVVAFLDALRQDADVIREVRDELGRHDRRTLTEIAERVGRQDEHAAALQHLLAHWIVRDVLYEPAADLARVERGENLLSSHLLGTIYEVVPFHGRTAELDALRAFREGAGDVGALVIEGEGGIGKTRLAMEAVYHAQRDRWQAGFLVRDQSLDTLRAGLAALNEGEQPVFVVVDYAEDRPEQLAALVAEWLAVPGPTRRVILLVRSKALLDQRLEPVPILDNRLRPAVDFLRGSLVQPLGASDLRLPPEEREPAFLEARQAFATRLGRPIDGLPALTEGFFTSAPEHAHFGLLLFLHMAALASLDGPPSVQRLDLIRYVLNRNWAYVTRLLDDDRQLDTLGIRQEDLHDVLTVATLVLAARPPDDSPRPDARDCLAVTDLGAELANRVRLLRDLARFLTDVFPGEASDGRATLDALRPDVLGEGLVFDTLNRRLELLDAVLAMDEASITSACVVLVRTALAHGSDPDTWLSRLLPLDRLKTAPAVAAILHDAIHPQSVGLARLAVDLAQIALDETIGEGEETDVPRSARL